MKFIGTQQFFPFLSKPKNKSYLLFNDKFLINLNCVYAVCSNYEKITLLKEKSFTFCTIDLFILVFKNLFLLIFENYHIFYL